MNSLIFCLIAAKELAENSHVQDAFVIAVEQQAKERLERLSALRKIKPVDMSTLSQQVRNVNEHRLCLLKFFFLVLNFHFLIQCTSRPYFKQFRCTLNKFR